MNFYPVKFIPIAQERIWGGSKLNEWFNQKHDSPIGEYWVLSEHPNGMSVVENGQLAGKTLVELTKQYPDAYLGNSPQHRFPLLIKFLEAQDDLSVQIHPNDQYAQIVENDFGKTEAWYILDCEIGTKINYGHTFTSREEYMQAVQQRKVKDYLSYKEIKSDDLVFVPSQTLHALLAGTILIEIQQTSDVTYRVYDWDRLDSNGKCRELHIEKAADVMIYDEVVVMDDRNHSRNTIVETDSIHHEHLVTCPYFAIEKLTIMDGAHRLQLGKTGNPDILIVADGEGALDGGGEIETLSLKRGDLVLIPSTIEEYVIRTNSDIILLRAYY